ncbi:hypothetical protein QYE76_031182 [Lolium multiflorum]|uniref:Retrotransposon protein, putative, unclassified n=1 Tax=Lolium multiflorum TaxID=4521 RepID=A0AAD8QT12_LOLMU|nr:hypothetical protein QYE76_031182 [Lolium multiflorum]
MTYGVFMAATKLKHYFEEHPMKVVSEAPISKIMGNKDASGRIAKWAIQLSPYVPAYERRDAIKSQALVDFLADWAEMQYKPPKPEMDYWKMHFDGSKLKEGVTSYLLTKATWQLPIGRYRFGYVIFWVAGSRSYGTKRKEEKRRGLEGLLTCGGGRNGAAAALGRRRETAVRVAGDGERSDEVRTATGGERWRAAVSRGLGWPGRAAAGGGARRRSGVQLRRPGGAMRVGKRGKWSRGRELYRGRLGVERRGVGRVEEWWPGRAVRAGKWGRVVVAVWGRRSRQVGSADRVGSTRQRVGEREAGGARAIFGRLGRAVGPGWPRVTLLQLADMEHIVHG